MTEENPNKIMKLQAKIPFPKDAFFSSAIFSVVKMFPMRKHNDTSINKNHRHGNWRVGKNGMIVHKGFDSGVARRQEKIKSTKKNPIDAVPTNLFLLVTIKSMRRIKRIISNANTVCNMAA